MLKMPLISSFFGVLIYMYKEINTGTNLPAQIDLYAIQGNEYKFLFVAKGGRRDSNAGC